MSCKAVTVWGRCFALLLWGLGCEDAAFTPPPMPSTRREPAPVQADEDRDFDSCPLLLDAFPPAKGPIELKAYYANLPRLLLYTHVVSVYYLQKPKASLERDLYSPAKRLFHELPEAVSPERLIRDFVDAHAGNKAFLQKVFLRQGYLFEDRPEVARAVVAELKIADLFDSDVVYLYRGGVKYLERDGDHYVDEDCQRATLLLNDRLAEDPADLAEPLHIDLDQVRQETKALRTSVRGLTDEGVKVDLIFPDGSSRSSLVKVEQGQTAVTCISDPQGNLNRTLLDAEQFWQQQAKLETAVKQMVAERPVFDEPKDEADDVQEDGELRLAWAEAYFDRQTTFRYREIEYPVFDRQGNPVPPQVCVDFLFDVLERASGTWFSRRGQKPRRMRGAVDFSVFKDLRRRQIPSVLVFAARQETPLERYDIPRRDWVPFEQGRAFANTLARHTAELREGDALIIHGPREEDGENHYHAVLILRTDPLTGMPVLVGDNAGRPRIRTLAQAMRSAPQRAIKHRIRLDREKLLLFGEQEISPGTLAAKPPSALSEKPAKPQNI